MLSTYCVALCIIIMDFANGQAMYEGEDCQVQNSAGSCRPLLDCAAAIDNLKKGIPPKICSFKGQNPIICCLGGAAVSTTTAPTTRPTPRTNKPPTNEDDDYYTDEKEKEPECPPIPVNASKVQKTGRKAWDKCIEYLELIYPCRNSPATVVFEKYRPDQCGHTSTSLIVGGQDTTAKEFPHMALLGYGSDVNNAIWSCGGSLISDQFVLTAGHCTYSQQAAEVTFVRLGVLKVSDKMLPENMYRVVEIIKHPEYKPPSKYNDIALLKMDRKVKMDGYVRPACIHTGNAVNDAKALATGWGTTSFQGSTSNLLQKVVLEKFTFEECKKKLPADRKLKLGIQDASQLCAGSHTENKDACQGDSGGPLQVYNTDVYCMYTLIGVTSFGKACGNAGSPGVYTRVAHYAPWIEQIVWP